jgi:hypothetical protein
MGFPNPSIAGEAARKAIAGDAPPSHQARQALDDEELRELESATYAKLAPQAATIPQAASAKPSIWRRFLDRFTRR